MAKRRGTEAPRLLAAGPGRLCQALGITREHDGAALDRPPFELHAGENVPVERGARVGITKAADRPWRYGEAGSRFLSRPIKPRPRS
jgi:DNA-3-methyladenine glycosylase